MRPPRTRMSCLLGLPLLLLVSVLLAACDGDGEPADGETPAATQETETTATPTPGAEGGPDAEGTPPAYTTPAPGDDPRTGEEIGRPASEEQIAAIDIDVVPGGEGLPEGAGTVAEGVDVYAANCARCHGATATEGGVGPVLVGETGPWEPGKAITIGSYWPYAETVFDYIRRSMPFDAPGSLSDDEVYAVVAWLLSEEGIIEGSAELDAETLPQVEMPNRDSFFSCWPEVCRPDVP